MTRTELDALRARLMGAERLGVDPLGAQPADASPWDRELAAYLTAGLAVGHVAAIGHSVRQVLACLDQPKAMAALPGHRWIRGPDIAAVAVRIRALQRQFGSLGAVFSEGFVPGDMRQSLIALSERLRSGVAPTRGVVSLTSSPATGSACKRINLFMRWMVRADDFDLGLWAARVPTSALMMPLDVHVVRFAHRVGATRRKSVSWKMVEEVTAWFAQRCHSDPLRWDFAVSHHGMTVGW